MTAVVLAFTAVTAVGVDQPGRKGGNAGPGVGRLEEASTGVPGLDHARWRTRQEA